MTQSNGKNYKLIDDYNGRWEENRAFVHAINSGRDKAFPTMADYISKRDAQIAKYRKMRKEKPLKHGERSRLSFELAGSWARLQPALYMIGFVVLITWALATRQFAPNTRPTIDVFGSGHKTHYIFMAYLANGEAPQIAVRQPKPLNPGYFISIGSVLTFAYYLRRWLRSRKKRTKIAPDKMPE